MMMIMIQKKNIKLFYKIIIYQKLLLNFIFQLQREKKRKKILSHITHYGCVLIVNNKIKIS